MDRPHFAIDVECVATSKSHNARSVAQLSLVDQEENVLLNLYVRPELPVISYLTPLTGLTRDIVESQGMRLQDAVDTLRRYLPASAVLVGQNIGKDVQWLGLKEGRDFYEMRDLAGLFRVWNDRYKTYSVFGQDHLSKVLLGWDTSKQTHDAVIDAIKSIRLFNAYNHLQTDPRAWESAQAALLNTPTQPSFAKLHPTYEGVCMGNRKTCTCGSAFIY